MPEPEVDKVLFWWHYYYLHRYNNTFSLLPTVYSECLTNICPEKKKIIKKHNNNRSFRPSRKALIKQQKNNRSFRPSRKALIIKQQNNNRSFRPSRKALIKLIAYKIMILNRMKACKTYGFIESCFIIFSSQYYAADNLIWRESIKFYAEPLLKTHLWCTYWNPF